MSRLSRAALIVSVAVGALGCSPAGAPNAPVGAREPSVSAARDAGSHEQGSPEDVYRAYRVALSSAQTLDDLRPFLARGLRAELDKIPEAQKREALPAFKRAASIEQLIVEGAKIEGDRATVRARGVQRNERGETTTLEGKAAMVREDGVWKFVGEDW